MSVSALVLRRIPWLLTCCLFLPALAVGCSAERGGAGVTLGSHTAALHQTYSASVTLPLALELADGALVASGSVLVQPSVKITGINADSAVVAGAPGLTAKSYGTVPNLWSLGNVTLSSSMTVNGAVHAAGTVSKKSSTRISGVLQQGSPIATRSALTFDVTFPDAPAPAVTLNGQSMTLPPGRYGDVKTCAASTLTLKAGQYYFESLAARLGTTLVVDDSAGPVQVYVAGASEISSRVSTASGTGANFLLVVFGTVAEVWSPAFAGTLVAPNALAHFLGGTGSTFRGSVFARDIRLGANLTMVHEPSAAIDWVSTPQVVAPTSAAPGFAPGSIATVLRSANVAVDVAAIQSSNNQRLSLSPFADVSLNLVGIRIERNLPDGFVWVGRVQGDAESLVALSVRGTIVAGTIRTRSDLFQIRYAGNGVHTVRSLDPNSFPSEADPAEVISPPPAPDADGDPCGGTETGNDIDVAVHYTPAVRDANGTGVDGVLATEALIYQAIAVSNQGYLDSDIEQRLRLVHLSEVAHVEDSNYQANRDALKDPSDGKMDTVHALRDLHGADIVALLIVPPNAGLCGQSYIMGNVATTFEDSAFAVVTSNCAVDNFSFPHELGHIMGARHDWYADSMDKSPYTHNHGWVDLANERRSVMAYASECQAQTPPVTCPRNGRWSNPDQSFGRALDLSQPADNRLTLNTTAATVANFRCTSPEADDVWMRDTWDDSGQEPDPNTAGQAMWKSPYIWVRNTQDTSLVEQHRHENPAFGVENWAYVKLHNGGGQTQGTLRLYWAEASVGLRWPDSWSEIGAGVAVTGFAADSSLVVEFPWSDLPGAGHYCLLARWDSPTEPMAEGVDIEANARGSNHIVWRNVNIVDPGADGAMDFDFLVEPSPNGQPVGLTFGPTADERNGSFLMYATATMKLPSELLMAWTRGGQIGQGFLMLSADTLLVTDLLGARLSNIALGTGGQKVRIHMERAASAPKRAFHMEATELVRAGDVDTDTRTVAAVAMESAGTTSLGGVVYEIRP